MFVAVKHSNKIADAQATLQETLRRMTLPSQPLNADNVPHPIPVRVVITRLSARVGDKDKANMHTRGQRRHKEGEWVEPPSKQTTPTTRKAYVLRLLWCGKSPEVAQELQTKLLSILQMQESNVVPSRLDGHYLYWALQLRQLDSFLEDAKHLVEGAEPLHSFLPTPMAEAPLQLAAVLSRVKLGFSNQPPPSIDNLPTLPVLMCMTLPNVQTQVENNRIIFLPRQEVSLMYHKPMNAPLCDFLAATCGTPRPKKCLPAGMLDTTFQQLVLEHQFPSQCAAPNIPPAETEWSVEQLLSLQEGHISLDQLLSQGKTALLEQPRPPQPPVAPVSTSDLAQRMIAQCASDPALFAELQRQMAPPPAPPYE